MRHNRSIDTPALHPRWLPFRHSEDGARLAVCPSERREVRLKAEEVHLTLHLYDLTMGLAMLRRIHRDVVALAPRRRAVGNARPAKRRIVRHHHSRASTV